MSVVLTVLAECLIISALTLFVSAALPSSVAELADGVVECIVSGVSVCSGSLRLSSCSCVVVVDVWSSSWNSANTSAMPCLSSSVVPVFVLQVCYRETFLRVDLMEVVFFEATEVAQDVCDVLASFVVFDRAYNYLDRLASVCFCLSVFSFCWVAFSTRVVVVIRRVRWSWLCCRGVVRCLWLMLRWSQHVGAYR